MTSISSPGIGSNLDVNGIVSKLMAVESQPLLMLQQREASFQAKISAYGTIKGAVSSFQTAVSGLSTASAFQQYSATAVDSSVLTATTTSSAVTGNYAITVNTLAQAQSISSAGQANTTSAIGTGTSTTLTFQFGTISGGALAGGIYAGSTFTQDATQATGTVVIDSSNNSLQGIRDAINKANIGVTATIVNDGSATNPYHLQITSNNTGLSKSMKITSSGGDASITNLLAYDPAGTQNLSQNVAAQNATLSVNGLSITSASNAVTGAVPGVTLNLTKGLGASTTLTVSNNTSAIVTAVQSFVNSYNAANKTIGTLTSYNSSTKQGGILLGDFTAQSIQTRMRSALGAALPGLGSNTLTNLSQIGVSFQQDGSLALDTTKLQTALASNFSDFPALFAAFGKSTDSLVNYIGSTSNSKAGSYAVNVTSLATQGKEVGSDKATQAMTTGSAAANLTITGGSNDKLLVTIDGGAAVPVTLTAGVYADATALATQVQSDINAALTAAGQTAQVSVTQNAGVLSVQSNTFGAASAISVASDPGFPGNTGASDLLGGAPTGSTVTTIKTGVNDQLTLGVNGTNATVTLAAGTYSASSLATQLQAAINGASAFTAAGISVSVSQAADVLTVTSNSYGSSSAVSISGGNAMTNLFGAAPTSTIGTNIIGTINGASATGAGQFLTGATGDASEGIKIQVVGGNTGARGTLNFSQGYAYNLSNLMSFFLGDSGSIASATDGANRSIQDLQNQEAAMQVQLAATQKRYLAQYTALDQTIGQMTSTSNYLAQQLANLPKIS
jgi:flagellar hook-associated protein 2